MKQQDRGTSRLKSSVSVLAAMVIFLAISAAATAQGLNGRWAATGKTMENGEQQKSVLELKQDGDKLSGKLQALGFANDVTGKATGSHFELWGVGWNDPKPFLTGDLQNDELHDR